MEKVQKLDAQLHEIVSGIDILEAVTPLNYREQKQEFFDSRFSVNPAFSYNTHEVDIFGLKRQLYNLGVDSLADTDLQRLYAEVIESYVDKIDQFESVGSLEFLYDSLRYYGEPSEKDLRNANFILHLPDSLEDSEERSLNAEAIVKALSEFARAQNYDHEIKLVDGMIANALVGGLTVKVNTAARASETEVRALAHHELGVHLCTTLNGRRQPLKILSLGSPVNTTTQEGLAILCEYLSGALTIPRLKVLALRVLAVASMIREKDFKKTFMLLVDQHGAEPDLAFTICARVYRGGGFTKDYLYLQGFHQMLNAYESRPDFHNLLSGKVSLEQLDLVTRLIDKGYLRAPHSISPAIALPNELSEVKQFIAHAIK
jgi:uncharacterized protein (TIGR02421 family)